MYTPFRPTRRAFAVAAASSFLLPLRAARLPIRKAVLFSMLPKSMSLTERFQLAIDAGFEQMECPQTDDPSEAEAIKKAAEAVKLRIHSVMNMTHWKFPL